jgi:hypothetical protein
LLIGKEKKSVSTEIMMKREKKRQNSELIIYNILSSPFFFFFSIKNSCYVPASLKKGVVGYE